MRSILSILLVILFINTAVAQAGGTVVAGGGVVAPKIGYRPVYLKDIFPDAMQPKTHLGLNGSPFIFDNWLLARLVLPDDRIADSVYVKLNAYEKTLHFKDDHGEEMQSRVRIKQITIIDNDPQWHNTVFRTGYTTDPNAFFMVIEDGKNLQLLEKIMIIKWETKVLGEEDKVTLQLDQELFFSANKLLYKSNKKCSQLAEVFETKQQAILQYISANAISCNKEADMKKLVTFVNSL